MSNPTKSQMVILIIAFVIILTTMVERTKVYAIGFNVQDFKIISFGINSQNEPFITVQGNDSSEIKPANSDTSYAFVFDTDKGTYAIMSHFGKDSSEQTGSNDLRYHAHQITFDKNNCINFLNDNGIAKLDGPTVRLSNTSATVVNKVFTTQLIIDNNHHICVQKVFDSKLNNETTASTTGIPGLLF
jgi:hypothetical protein